MNVRNCNCVFTSVPTGVASIELESRTDTSLSVAWAEPQNTDLARYDVNISPNDGGENLPIRVNKYVEKYLASLWCGHNLMLKYIQHNSRTINIQDILGPKICSHVSFLGAVHYRMFLIT